MRRRSKHILLGAFVLGALGLALVAGVLLGVRGLAKKGLDYVVFFPGSISGLSVGSPVSFRGVDVGSVKDIIIQYDRETATIQIPVIIEINPNHVRALKEAEPARRNPREVIDRLTQRGLRARLKNMSLVTGRLAVELDLHPDVPPRLSGAYPALPELPTMPSSAEEVKQALEQLPLEKIAEELLLTLQDFRSLVNNPGLPASATSVAAAAQELRGLARTLESEALPALKEVGGAARSVRVFVDYLDRHPEALIRGKGDAKER